MAKAPRFTKDWLDADGRFLFGKYAGRLAEEVARTNPDYLRWIIDEVEDCSDEDREVLSALVARRG